MLVSEPFTPEVLLSAPRRSPAVPNHDGTLALYTVSTHSWSEKSLSEVRVMNIESGASEQLAADDKIHDVLWLPSGDNEIIYLKSGEKGVTRVMVADASTPASEHHQVAEFNAPLKALKVKGLQDGSVIFAVAALADDDGSLYNDEAKKPKSTARIFDTFRVRVVSVPPTKTERKRAPLHEINSNSLAVF
jgi:hypothetical protein